MPLRHGLRRAGRGLGNRRRGSACHRQSTLATLAGRWRDGRLLQRHRRLDGLHGRRRRCDRHRRFQGGRGRLDRNGRNDRRRRDGLRRGRGRFDRLSGRRRWNDMERRLYRRRCGGRLCWDGSARRGLRGRDRFRRRGDRRTGYLHCRSGRGRLRLHRRGGNDRRRWRVNHGRRRRWHRLRRHRGGWGGRSRMDWRRRDNCGSFGRLCLRYGSRRRDWTFLLEACRFRRSGSLCQEPRLCGQVLRGVPRGGTSQGRNYGAGQQNVTNLIQTNHYRSPASDVPQLDAETGICMSGFSPPCMSR